MSQQYLWLVSSASHLNHDSVTAKESDFSVSLDVYAAPHSHTFCFVNVECVRFYCQVILDFDLLSDKTLERSLCHGKCLLEFRKGLPDYSNFFNKAVLDSVATEFHIRTLGTIVETSVSKL